MRCAKHNVETAVSCGRCETPVCPRCMVHSDVGVRCRSCAPARLIGPSARNKSVLGIVVAVVLVILAIGYVGSSGGSGSDDYGYGDYGYDDYYDWDYDVTVSGIEDPWEPEDGAVGASPGYRLVAIEVVVEASPSNAEAYPTGWYDFKLTDDEEFAYGPLDSGAKPAFPESVSLEPGEKTRGWVTFEVAEGNGLESLSSYDEVVPLSDDVSRAP